MPLTIERVGLFLLSMLFWPKIRLLTIVFILYSTGTNGVPIFTGGSAGISKMLSSNFGFLISYIPEAYIVGRFNNL